MLFAMENMYIDILEQIQRLIVRLVATNPAGQGLCLIGGFQTFSSCIDWI